MTDPVLRLAARRGILLLPTRGAGGVELAQGVLIYDPAIRREDRNRLVLAALRRDAAKKLLRKGA